MTEPCEIRQAAFEVGSLPAFFSRIRDIAGECGVHIILLDAGRMAGPRHVHAALSHAFRACAEGRMISRSVEMEALLYAAGTRQVQTAISFGVHPGLNRSYIGICPPSRKAGDQLAGMVSWIEGSGDTVTPEKECLLMEIFGITHRERTAAGRASLEDLVIERVALLDANR